MKTIKNRIFLVGLIMVGSSAFGQTDSTDLDLSMNQVVLENEMDTLFYDPPADYGNLILEFDISDVLNFGSVHFELVNAGSEKLLFKDELDMTELLTLGIISGVHVTINMGNLERNSGYELNLAVENNLGLVGPILTKHFEDEN